MGLILETLQFLGILCLVLVVFNVLIVVHELGHFLAARWRGLKIEKFQIWFGKRLWSKEVNGVQYGLGSIPAGGFVALPQMAPMEMLEGNTDDGGEPLQPISPLDKIIVAFAGPLFSFGLAAVFALIVYMVGHPVNKAGNSTVIGWVVSGSPAQDAGLLPGDNILEVDGKPVKTFQGMVDSVMWNIISSESDQVPFKLDRPGVGIMELTVTKAAKGEAEGGAEEVAEPKGWWGKGLAYFKRPQLRKVGIAPDSSPVIVEGLNAFGPAEEAGLRVGDVVENLNGQKLYSASALEQFAAENGNAPLILSILRDGTPMEIKATPRMAAKPGSVKKPTLGIKQYGSGEEAGTTYEYPPVHLQLINTLKTMANTIGAVASPKSDVSLRHLSGPVGIIDLYYRLFRSPDGWRLVLWFSVLLNVNLAVLNMLPLPVLDGGHITMALIEGIFRRRINLKVLEVVQTACALLLISFMLFVTLFDGGDILRRNQPQEKFVEPEFLPPSARDGSAMLNRDWNPAIVAVEAA